MIDRYYAQLLRCAVKGALARKGCADIVLPEDVSEITKLAEELGIKPHYFKRSALLPRVKKVLGFLTSIAPSSLLDVGSGRGAFLFPCLESFPYTWITSLDILEHRVDLLECIEQGGMDNFRAIKGDLCVFDAKDHTYEVVTLLEVLEHIPDVKTAIANAVRMAEKYVVVTVPSEEDDNPEHIHMLTKEKLTAYFNECGVTRLSFDGVPGHLVMIARI